MLKIKIAGTVFENVAKIEPEVKYTYNYNVTTMDGVQHREVKGVRTNYDVMFFNSLNGDYEDIKDYLQSHDTVQVGILNADGTTYTTREYFATIGSEIHKGLLDDGTYYFTGLPVKFEAVSFDE